MDGGGHGVVTGEEGAVLGEGDSRAQEVEGLDFARARVLAQEDGAQAFGRGAEELPTFAAELARTLAIAVGIDGEGQGAGGARGDGQRTKDAAEARGEDLDFTGGGIGR